MSRPHTNNAGARHWRCWLMRELGIPVRVGRPRTRPKLVARRHRLRAYLNGERHMVEVWRELARKSWR